MKTLFKNFCWPLLLLCSFSCKEKDGHHVTPAAQKETAPEPVTHSAYVPEGYELVWNDEFSGAKLNGKKWGYPKYKQRGAAQMNTPGTVRCQDGMLHLTTLWKDNKIHASYISTRNRFERVYGYYEARIQFQKLQGHHGAFWLQSRNFSKGINDPAKHGTEMDIIEWFGDGRRQGWAGMHVYYNTQGQDGKVTKRRNLAMPSFHLMGGPSTGAKEEVLEHLSDRFRVYGLLWTEKGCHFFCDGVEIMTEQSIVSQAPQFIVLSLLCENWERQRLQVDKLPDAMKVDYVRVYAPKKQPDKPSE